MPSYTLSGVQRDFMKFTSQQIKFDLKGNHLKVLEQFNVDSIERSYQILERNSLNTFLYSREVIEQKLDYIH
ncbi:MAG: hypothetical protein M3512_02515 [Bacteroidota bacterium]|nr:hypothetical protein [Bacteroidota bacterium]